MAGVSFERSPEVAAIAIELIDLHHPHLQDAKDLIGYYIREGSSDCAGKCHKCSAFEREITKKMFIIWVNKAAWGAMELGAQKSLLDHELCHIGRATTSRLDTVTNKFVTDWLDRDDPENWHIVDHDVEEFAAIIERHGLQVTHTEEFAKSVRKASYQISFEDLEAEGRAREKLRRAV